MRLRSCGSGGSRVARAVTVIAASAAFGGTMLLAPAAEADQVGSDRAGADRAGKLPVLRGSVGRAFVIEFSETSVPAGRYKIVIDDRSHIHNFHVKGDGVDEKTGVPFIGKQVWRVTLREGIYDLQCDAHTVWIHTTLEVTA